MYAVLADHRLKLFPDELFADLFPSGRGRPSVPGDVMATALVLKELEGLSDRQAADALRCDIRWKVATGLALDHPGVHWGCGRKSARYPSKIPTTPGGRCSTGS
jgi:hypothetical protein